MKMSPEYSEINNSEHLTAEEAIAIQADLIGRSGKDPMRWVDEEAEKIPSNHRSRRESDGIISSRSQNGGRYY